MPGAPHSGAFGRIAVAVAALLGCVLLSGAAHAQKQYGPGVTDTEIKIGNMMPYSGPASMFSAIGKAEEAYFRMLNERGGINGRKINFISYDDAYSPPKAVEQVRRLVEGDEVLLVFGSLGTPTNAAIQKYLNTKNVPQLFPAASGTRFARPDEFPWTMMWNPPYDTEGKAFARFLAKAKPDGKIAVLYQNDDFGKDVVQALKDGLGAKASQIVALESYETTQPTVDSHVVKLQATGADILLTIATPKFAAQAVKKVAELGWKPLHIVDFAATTDSAVIQAVGPEVATGLISAAFLKDPSDPLWKDDPAMKEYLAFLQKYMPNADRGLLSNVYGYAVAQTVAQILAQCGDNLTRENVMKQAQSLKDFVLPILLPGIKMTTGPNDYRPIEQLQLVRYNGTRWEAVGDVVGGGD
jgi:branched-chain amino acid transport system substrate-binding protein